MSTYACDRDSGGLEFNSIVTDNRGHFDGVAN
jgi:hypothetical protein